MTLHTGRGSTAWQAGPQARRLAGDGPAVRRRATGPWLGTKMTIPAAARARSRHGHNDDGLGLSLA